MGLLPSETQENASAPERSSAVRLGHWEVGQLREKESFQLASLLVSWEQRLSKKVSSFPGWRLQGNQVIGVRDTKREMSLVSRDGDINSPSVTSLHRCHANLDGASQLL